MQNIKIMMGQMGYLWAKGKVGAGGNDEMNFYYNAPSKSVPTF